MRRLRLALLCAAAVLAVGVTTYLVAANGQHAHKRGANAPGAESGPLSSATVSFGAWMTSPPLDRFSNVPPPPPTNHHVVLPQVAKIKAGGTVNFIISGLHNIAVYDDGTKPEDIDTSLLDVAPPVPVINDPDRRIYRGLDPRKLLPVLDRVEVVHFAEPGTYLVICGVLPHFQEGMYGYVKVVP